MISEIFKDLQRTNLSDYESPAFTIPSIKLRIELDPENTLVTSELMVRREAGGENAPLVLNGSQINLESIALNGTKLVYDEYRFDRGDLILDSVPDEFNLTIENSISPSANEKLLGLYLSGDIFTTQCEAEGFRAITFFPDRPDVLSKFNVTLVGDRNEYPVMLSNGEQIDCGDLPGNRHFVIWDDPNPKPCYLFAIVAGRLSKIREEFMTRSNRRVLVEFYAPEEDLSKCEWAMQSLLNAMRWDEQVYGREYDLNRYMVVAVDRFNMGAMENKGLNIFNSKYVYAQPQTATDRDYHSIEAVIAHEYFHNWSGNRVTLRDWFQLSLKEGFTIFREQQFSADMGSQSVQRIHDANMIKLHQFLEDSGPTAHAVQPDSYVTINNFYTLTVYNKGAELIRMLRVLLGAEKYRNGTDLYFEHNDGMAVTIEEFVAALQDAGGIDLSQFKRWYKTVGTPGLVATRMFNPQTKTYTLTLEQRAPETQVANDFLPLHIPVQTVLFGTDGKALPLHMTDNGDSAVYETVLSLKEQKQTFTFHNIDSEPVPSLLRGFSAPVHLRDGLSESELCFLAINDTDSYCRWDALQRVAKLQLLQLVASFQNNQSVSTSDAFIEVFGSVLGDLDIDPQFKALLLALPTETAIGQEMNVIDPTAIHLAREALLTRLAKQFFAEFMSLYRDMSQFTDDAYSSKSAGCRSLRNACLTYLIQLDTPEVWDLAHRQYAAGSNMTNREAALQVIVASTSPKRQEILDDFYTRFAGDSLVTDKWFRVQAICARDGTLDRVRELTQHPSFNLSIPNRIFSLIGVFCSANPYCFHAADGSGYELLREYVCKIDQMNPQLAARLVENFSQIRKYNEARQRLMHKQLQQIADAELSTDLAEVVDLILKPTRDAA